MYGFFSTKREYYEQRLASLKIERASWETPWIDICQQLVPYRIILDPRSKRNRGDREEGKILNCMPVQALETLSAGMMAGITSPARKWFALTLDDNELAEFKAVKEYLEQCQSILQTKFQESNWYPSLAMGVYPDLGSIGQSAMFEEEGGPGLVHFNPLPIGEYSLDVNGRQEIDTCIRELALSVRQVVQMFGLNNLSQAARNAWDRSNYGEIIMVAHAVTPNSDMQPNALGPASMKFRSCWWERSTDKLDAFLREGGFEEFPVLAPRWMVRSGDVYGRGPGWKVRGDCRMLQHHERRAMQLLDKIESPPMRATGNIKRASLLPGDVTHLPKGQEASFEPAVDTGPMERALDRVEARIARTEKRIDGAFFVDLLRTFIDDERDQRATATEIDAKRQEKMLMFGPVLENLDRSLLAPAIERTFAILDRNNMLPLPPPELQGKTIKVKFISIMHQAQQSTELLGIRTFVGDVTALSQIRPEALDKVNADAIVDKLGEITGIDPDAILSKDEVEQVRQERAKQQQAQQQGQAMLAASQGVRNVSAADPQKLSDLAGMISPVAAAQAGALQSPGGQ